MLIRFRHTVIAAVVLILAFGVLVLPISAQDQPPGEELLEQVRQFLSQKTGRPIAGLDNYTYEINTYPDGSLGCPAEGQTYQPAQIRAYRFLVTAKGISYDVRTSIDGTIWVLCPGSDLKQSVSLATYRNAMFSIPYPDYWSIIDRQIDIFFGLSPTPVCAQPGMTVIALGKVPAEKTADALLDEYKQITPNSRFEDERISVRNIGRSVMYVAPCTDGSPRQARVTVFIAYGQAYRILQFAPQNAYNQWSDVFLQILKDFSPSTVGGGDGSAIVFPTVSPLAMIAHIFAGNVYVGSLTDLPGTPITRNATNQQAYRDIAVSPKGDLIAFIDPANAILYSAPSSGGEIRKLGEKLAVGYPAAWNLDGTEIIYLVDEGEREGDAVFYSIIAARSDGSGSRKIGNTLGIRVGVDMVTGDPAESLYWNETSFGGNSLLLTYTSDEMIYYSLGNDGMGVGLMAADGSKSEVINDELRRIRFSPDGTELLGVLGEDNVLVRLNLKDRSVSILPTAAPPDQIAWGIDGKSLFYSTLSAPNPILLDAEEDRERGLSLFGTWPFQTVSFNVSLRHLDMETGVDAELFKLEGRGIGRLAPSPDGSGVLFTLVQSSTKLVEAFRNNAADMELRRQSPTTQLYWQPLPTGNAILLAISSGAMWGPLGSALAPTPTGGFQTSAGPTPIIVTSVPATATPTSPAGPSSTPGSTVG